MSPASACYGKMFPRTLVTTENEETRGKVFGYRIHHRGVVASGRAVTADLGGMARVHTVPGSRGLLSIVNKHPPHGNRPQG
jgi:hypothetical protein